MYTGLASRLYNHKTHFFPNCTFYMDPKPFNVTCVDVIYRSKTFKMNDDMSLEFKILATTGYDGCPSGERMLSFLILGIIASV